MADKFRREHVVEEVFEISQKQDWNLKDILFVPIDEKSIAFRVEHITNDKIYFVAVNSIRESTVENVNRFLDIYLSKFPDSLKKRMREIEHKKDGKVVRKSKLTLLSYANVWENTGDHSYDGADDIPFVGLLTDAEKVKNWYGCGCEYFLDTPDFRNSRYLLYVDYSGNIYSYGGRHSTGGTVPCFALKRKE